MILKKIIPINKISCPLLIEKDISLDILRLDQTDSLISGNKWFKLKYNLFEAKKQGFKTLLSFGGPYSNHIHALAAAGKKYHFNSIGIIRGEKHCPLNQTLSDTIKNGMKHYYIDRKTYRNKHTSQVIKQLLSDIEIKIPFPGASSAEDIYIVPEGGTNALAIKGAAEIVSFIPAECDFICLPCGTGGTIAGIISGVHQSQHHHAQIFGFPALKGGEFLQQTISSLILIPSEEQRNSQTSWQLFYHYHFGGFGKMTKELALFIQDFENKQAIELDPVYTSKMLYAIMDMIKRDFFPKGSRITAIHTGGLQGKRGLAQKIQTLIHHG
ncbi:MAG: 1-aminocyclopropane-1-carboxylate deaminase/D-cysteine desulfhydrase [gamma proteobacterium symbiont of Taylorina sp.]|nr:1-aminocyclopropane-1-carboxylate deaminase/D-cysteine desulfhydrase [gamma proteobacterium symbiont of Taylorina sp.]